MVSRTKTRRSLSLQPMGYSPLNHYSQRVGKRSQCPRFENNCMFFVAGFENKPAFFVSFWGGQRLWYKKVCESRAPHEVGIQLDTLDPPLSSQSLVASLPLRPNTKWWWVKLGQLDYQKIIEQFDPTNRGELALILSWPHKNPQVPIASSHVVRLLARGSAFHSKFS